MKKLLLLLCALAATTAFADDTSALQTPTGSKDSGTSDLGMYGQVEVGAANSSDLNSGVDAAGAIRMSLGYKFSPYMGLEMGITGVTQPNGGAVQAPLQFFDASFKGFLPISSYFDFHAQAGLAYAYMAAPTNSSGVLLGSGADSTAKGLVGAGFDIYVTRSIAITVDDYAYLGADGNSNYGTGGNTNIVMGGLKYNF